MTFIRASFLWNGAKPGDLGAVEELLGSWCPMACDLYSIGSQTGQSDLDMFMNSLSKHSPYLLHMPGLGWASRIEKTS